MKKAIKALIFYFGIIAISLIWDGCIEIEARIVGSGTHINAYGPDIFNYLDTINTPFYIEIQYEVQEVATIPQNTGFINHAYGLWPKYYHNINNPVLLESVEIVSNKEFSLAKNVINPNVDFINSVGIEPHWLSVELMEVLRITFDQEFLDLASFKKEHYTFTIYAETTDGIPLENSITLFMDLD